MPGGLVNQRWAKAPANDRLQYGYDSQVIDPQSDRYLEHVEGTKGTKEPLSTLA